MVAFKSKKQLQQEAEEGILGNTAVAEVSKKTLDELNIDNNQGVTVSSEYDIQVVRDIKGIDFFHIPNPDKKYAYRFILKEDRNLTVKTGNLLHAHGGWKLVDKQHAERIGLGKQVGSDGLCHAGELVLGFMPKELYAEKEAYKKSKAKTATSDIDNVLKNGKEENSFSSIHDSMKGLQTEKQLGGNFK